MMMIEPKKPRKQELDYTVCNLPEEVLAVVRLTWYKDGKADEVDETILLEDGQNGYDAFAALIQVALRGGANVSVRSGYRPEQLGIMT
jgi:hypothetical protein